MIWVEDDVRGSKVLASNSNGDKLFGLYGVTLGLKSIISDAAKPETNGKS